jgi:hypothetical protein
MHWTFDSQRSESAQGPQPALIVSPDDDAMQLAMLPDRPLFR